MYNLMVLDGNDMGEVLYPDTLLDAFNMAHECGGGNGFIITGNDVHLVGSVTGANKISWKRGA